MHNNTEKIEEVMKKVEKDNVKFVQLVFTDLTGAIKTVTIPVEHLKGSLEKGTWFDGSSIEGFTRISESDMYLVPDPSTYTVIPWRPKEKTEARFICDVYTPDHKPFDGDPRTILKKVVKEAEELGYQYNVGPELEFFLFKLDEHGDPQTDPHDKAGYFDFAPRDMAMDVRREIICALEDFGIEVEMSHHEVGPGQHEIDFRYGDAVTQADRAISMKETVKTIALKHGLHATFMPKPIFGENGSGMHVHQSLFDVAKGKNAFFDANDPYKISELAKHFIAGQLKHIKAMCAVIAPTINSYKRLVPGYEAPVYVCWGQKNRSALIRIPRYSPGREESTRAELRCPDPSCNPYLAFAVMLKAGLDGIKNKLELGNPVEESAYEVDEKRREELGIGTLPTSLHAAVEELKNDEVVKSALGSHTFEKFVKSKQIDWDNYKMQVTKWEMDKYFDVM